ncbi:hypothetical protein PZA11_004952 [Diplocarpon coronariae]
MICGGLTGDSTMQPGGGGGKARHTRPPGLGRAWADPGPILREECQARDDRGPRWSGGGACAEVPGPGICPGEDAASGAGVLSASDGRELLARARDPEGPAWWSVRHAGSLLGGPRAVAERGRSNPVHTGAPLPLVAPAPAPAPAPGTRGGDQIGSSRLRVRDGSHFACLAESRVPSPEFPSPGPRVPESRVPESPLIDPRVSTAHLRPLQDFFAPPPFHACQIPRGLAARAGLNITTSPPTRCWVGPVDELHTRTQQGRTGPRTGQDEYRMAQETRDRRQETGDRGTETGARRDRRKVTGDRRQETGDRTQGTGEERKVTGDRRPALYSTAEHNAP